MLVFLCPALFQRVVRIDPFQTSPTNKTARWFGQDLCSFSSVGTVQASLVTVFVNPKCKSSYRSTFPIVLWIIYDNRLPSCMIELFISDRNLVPLKNAVIRLVTLRPGMVTWKSHFSSSATYFYKDFKKMERTPWTLTEKVTLEAY